jgi:hypothetical protein
MPKSEKAILYQEDVPLVGTSTGLHAPAPGKLEDKLLTALKELLGAYTVKQPHRGSVFSVSRPVRIEKDSGGTRLIRPSALIELENVYRIARSYGSAAITIKAGGHRNRFRKRYALVAAVSRHPEHWTFAYTVNLAAIRSAIEAALLHALKDAEAQDLEVKNRQLAEDACKTRLAGLKALLGPNAKGCSLQGEVLDTGMTYTLTLPRDPVTGRAALPYLTLFPDAPFHINWEGLQLVIPETMLDAALAAGVTYP